MLHFVAMFMTNAEAETAALCPISGFRREVDESCPPLCYYAASSGNFLPTFCDNLSVPSALPWFITQRVAVISCRSFELLTPKDGTTRCSRNVCKKLPLLGCVMTQKSTVTIWIFFLLTKREERYSRYFWYK